MATQRAAATCARHASGFARSQCQARRYVTRRRSPASEIFDLSKIPPSSIESVIARNGGGDGDDFTALSPGQYYAVAQKFTNAIDRGSSPWTVSSTSESITPQTMHSLGCIMRQIHNKTAHALAMALWSSASSAGHRAATLSLTRLLVRRDGRLRPEFSHVEAHFKQLVAGGQDADALTTLGEVLFRQGRFDAAIATLRRALDAAGEFEWRPFCELCLARALIATSKTGEAVRLLERLADEGLIDADVELVKLGHDVEQRAYTAACHGKRDMFARLAEMELARGGEDATLWAVEWSRLAESKPS